MQSQWKGKSYCISFPEEAEKLFVVLKCKVKWGNFGHSLTSTSLLKHSAKSTQ